MLCEWCISVGFNCLILFELDLVVELVLCELLLVVMYEVYLLV